MMWVQVLANIVLDAGDIADQRACHHWLTRRVPNEIAQSVAAHVRYEKQYGSSSWRNAWHERAMGQRLALKETGVVCTKTGEVHDFTKKPMGRFI